MRPSPGPGQGGKGCDCQGRGGLAGQGRARREVSGSVLMCPHTQALGYMCSHMRIPHTLTCLHSLTWALTHTHTQTFVLCYPHPQCVALTSQVPCLIGGILGPDQVSGPAFAWLPQDPCSHDHNVPIMGLLRPRLPHFQLHPTPSTLQLVPTRL